MEHHILVGGFNPSEKYESQLGWLFHIIPNLWKNHPVMFQSTNQYRWFTYIYLLKVVIFHLTMTGWRPPYLSIVFFPRCHQVAIGVQRPNLWELLNFTLRVPPSWRRGGQKSTKKLACVITHIYFLWCTFLSPPSSHIYVWISIAKKSVLSTLEMALTFFFVWKHQHHPVRWELGVSNFKLLKFPVDINPPHNPWVWRKIWVMTSLDLHFFSFLGTWTTWTTWSIPFWSWDTKMDHP